MDVSNFFASNIPLFAICLVMILISVRNFRMRKKESVCFLIFAGILLLLSIVVAMEIYACDNGLIYLGTIFTSIGYSVRPILLLIFIFLGDMDQKRNPWFYRVFIIAIIANAIIYLLPWFFNVPGVSNAVFHYELVNGKAIFIRDSFLNYSSHIISLAFLAVLTYLSYVRFRGIHRRDGLVLILCAAIILSTVVTEMVLQRTDLLNITSGICIMVDYIFIVTINSSKDLLTGLYDRRTFHDDIGRFKNSVNGIVVLDMNELKYYNDNFGHETGDEGLKTLANIFKASIVPATMCAYRLSGDEFLILMFQGKKEQLESTISKIKENSSQTKYSCALGSYFIDKGDSISFEEAINDAEKAMYKDKNDYYVRTGHDRRGR